MLTHYTIFCVNLCNLAQVTGIKEKAAMKMAASDVHFKQSSYLALTASFKALPALNLGAFEALIFIVLPV